METLSAQQAHNLIRIRGYYQNSDMETENAEEILQLLAIIDSLENFNMQSRKIETHACIMVIRGYYKEAEGKLMHALQFTVISNEPNEQKIMKDIQTRFGSSVLRGFNIVGVERFAIHEKLFLCGTGLGG
jgi:hypothetical protein